MKEIGWKMPEGQKSLLYTSCKIDKLMDFAQMKRYQKCDTNESPETMIQVSAAVYFNYITREQGLKELEERHYFNELQCFEWVLQELGLTRNEVQNVY